MTHRKKILFLIESLSGGGAEKILTTILNNINTNKFDVTLCCIVNTGQFLNDIPNNVAYQYIIPNPKETNSLWSKLKYTLKYKLVYSWLPLNWVYKLWVPKGNDIEIAFVEGFSTKLLSKSSSKSKKIAWLHTDFGYNHWTPIVFKNNRQEEVTYSKFNNVVCVSHVVKDSLLKIYPTLNNVIVKYNPINDILIRDMSTISSGIECRNVESLKLISVGRLTPQKGYDRLLPIIKRLYDNGHNISLTILGEGSERNKLEEYIAKNNLENIVSLPGFTPNPYSIIKEHDLFVCSSRAEGYSTAVTEALILGLPVITTDCSGMRELLGENNEYGVVVQNDEESLYNGIKKFLENKSYIEFYTTKAIERGKKFSLTSLMNEIEDIL